MKLSNFYPNIPISQAAQIFRVHTLETGLTMYKNGWTVIGSYFKASKLHPWKETTKEQLKQWAISDFQLGRANSINLRLNDSQVIALDCDFPNEQLTKDFIKALPCVLSIMPNRPYTCAGGKGCKVFFKLHNSFYSPDKLPTKLGRIAYDPSTQLKHELEIKTTLSTVLGLHSAIGDSNNILQDYRVYSAYPGTKLIAAAKPDDLPLICVKDLKAIEVLYNNLIQAAHFNNEQGEPLNTASYKQLLFSSLCLFAQSFIWDNQQERITFDNLQVCPNDVANIEQAYLALGLKDAIECIKHIFLGDLSINNTLKEVCELFKQEVLLTDLAWAEVDNMASYAYSFLQTFEQDYLRRRAREIGADDAADSIYELTRALMWCYENYKPK